MPFWAYMLQCADRTIYLGHTDDLENRLGQHQEGIGSRYTSTRRPVHLVWSQEFPSRYEALSTERQLKGWSRAKKLALIRGDWAAISELARGSRGEGRASTSSARTVWRAKALLHPHLNTTPTQPFSLESSVRLNKSDATFGFDLRGPIGNLRFPDGSLPSRRDNLWQHTCFEIFAATGSGYAEINLAPSTEWAAYCFDAYRSGMYHLETTAPRFVLSLTEKRLHLRATLPLPFHPTRIGLSAVIEEKSGHKSYWALRHPPGDAPDFHHPDCFALEVPPLG